MCNRWLHQSVNHFHESNSYSHSQSPVISFKVIVFSKLRCTAITSHSLIFVHYRIAFLIASNSSRCVRGLKLAAQLPTQTEIYLSRIFTSCHISSCHVCSCHVKPLRVYLRCVSFNHFTEYSSLAEAVNCNH